MPDYAGDRVAQIESLVRRVEAIADATDRDAALSLMQAILTLHGRGLERLLETVSAAGDSGRTLMRRFAADELTASLLVLHGLHPDDLETRARHALSKLHGPAELVGVFEGTVRVRLSGSACSSLDTISAALGAALPDAAEIVFEESPLEHFVPLQALGAALPSAPR